MKNKYREIDTQLLTIFPYVWCYLQKKSHFSRQTVKIVG